MAVLATVQDYVTQARVLLQDQVVQYRYADSAILQALNLAMFEVRRLRPDILVALATTPSFSAVDTTAVSIDEQYRLALVYFMVGFVQLVDDEETQDQRAGAFLQKFTSTLVGLS